MSDFQKQEVRKILDEHEAVSAIHGGCIGADEDFHNICLEIGIPEDSIFILPGISANDPTDRSMQAVLKGGVRLPEKTHFARNRDIVNASDMLIATPLDDVKRGGTWYTIDYADGLGKLIHIIGRGEREEGGS